MLDRCYADAMGMHPCDYGCICDKCLYDDTENNEVVIYKDKNGYTVNKYDFIENGDELYMVLNVTDIGVEVVEVTEEEGDLVKIGEPWIKTRSEIAKCQVYVTW